LYLWIFLLVAQKAFLKTSNVRLLLMKTRRTGKWSADFTCMSHPTMCEQSLDHWIFKILWAVDLRYTPFGFA